VVRWAELDRKGGADAAPPADAAAAGDAILDPGHTVEVGIQMLPGLARAGAVRYTGARAVAQATAGKSGSTAALILDNFSRGSVRTGASAKPSAAPAGRAAAGAALPEIDEVAVEAGDAGEAGEAPTGTPRYSDRATIVLPAGWSREEEVIEFIDGAVNLKLRLGALAQRHGDFERMHFEVVD
jgi:hypothetical protein